jgi:hypothetical protein
MAKKRKRKYSRSSGSDVKARCTATKKGRRGAAPKGEAAR